MGQRVVTVTGMSCNGCEENVETALKNLGGVTRVEADHTADTVAVVLDETVDDDTLLSAIKQAGYDVSA